MKCPWCISEVVAGVAMACTGAWFRDMLFVGGGLLLTSSGMRGLRRHAKYDRVVD